MTRQVYKVARILGWYHGMAHSSVQSPGSTDSGSKRRQGVYWLLTIPAHEFTPWLPPGLVFLRGQLESGGTTGYLHWQLLATFSRKASLRAVRLVFGQSCHAELTRSSAADLYVWKDDTAVPGTRFELGAKPFRRQSPADWAAVRLAASRGDLQSVPDDVYVRYYGNLRRIAADNASAPAVQRSCIVLWGPTSTGKSRTAWSEAGDEAYAKDPRTKWWCGYRGQQHCVIDEFRGAVDISHLLRWLDRYPVFVETKGCSVPLRVTRFWITSNLSPDEWYPDLDQPTLAALKRRIRVVHMVLPILPEN